MNFSFLFRLRDILLCLGFSGAGSLRGKKTGILCLYVKMVEYCGHGYHLDLSSELCNVVDLLDKVWKMASTGTRFRNRRCVLRKCHGGGLLSLDAHFPGKLINLKGLIVTNILLFWVKFCAEVITSTLPLQKKLL